MDPITAPWWGVPVVAGLFLLIGAFIGFLFNRANENHKFARERNLERALQVVNTGTDLLTTAAEVRRLAADAIGRGDDAMSHIAADSQETLDTYLRASSRFTLVMPVDAAHLRANLDAASILLSDPIFEVGGIRRLIHEQDKASRAVTNLIRKHQGIPPLPDVAEPYRPDAAEDLTKGLIEFSERLGKRDADSPAKKAEQ